MDTDHLLILEHYDVSWFCNKCKPKTLNVIHTDKEIEDRCAEHMSRITQRIAREEKALAKGNKGRFGEQCTGNKHTATHTTTGDQEADTTSSTNYKHSPNNDSTNQPRPGFCSEGRNNRKRTYNGKTLNLIIHGMQESEQDEREVKK